MPQRIQRKRTKGWRMPPGAVNVTRGTDWGNPFQIGSVARIVTFNGPSSPAAYVNRRLAVELYRAWVVEHRWQDQIRHELGGKDLVCWCALDQECHADVLLEIANSDAATRAATLATKGS